MEIKQIKILIGIVVCLLLIMITWWMTFRLPVKLSPVAIDNSSNVDVFKISQKAIDANNEEECLVLTGSDLDNCFYALATINNKFSLCGKIKDSDLQLRCNEKNIVNNSVDIKKCSSIINSDLQYQCKVSVFNFATSTNSCQSVAMGDIDLCYDTVNFNQSIAKRDLNLCSKIKDSYKKQDCLEIINRSVPSFK